MGARGVRDRRQGSGSCYHCALLAPLAAGVAELVIGSRTLGGAERGALTPQQRVSNAIAVAFIRLAYGGRCTDLGPLRAIRWEALGALGMRDRNYGWTRRRVDLGRRPEQSRTAASLPAARTQGDEGSARGRGRADCHRRRADRQRTRPGGSDAVAAPCSAWAPTGCAAPHVVLEDAAHVVALAVAQLRPEQVAHAHELGAHARQRWCHRRDRPRGCRFRTPAAHGRCDLAGAPTGPHPAPRPAPRRGTVPPT